MNWFNEWVLPSLWQDTDSECYGEQLKFDGSKCYELRCAVLHSGDTEGIATNGSSKGDPMDEFDLCVFPDRLSVIRGMSRFGVRWGGFGESDKYYVMRLDVVQLCGWITDAVENFYSTLSDKSAFDKHQLRIIDMDV